MVKVSGFVSKSGYAVANQYVIETKKGDYFQSYDSVIAFKPNAKGKKVILDEYYWDYSVTTSKYRNKFLGEDKKQTTAKIVSGEYKFGDLNNSIK